MNNITRFRSSLMTALFGILMWLLLPYAQAAPLSDGIYSVDYVVVKAENDSVSMANDYFQKPAKVTVSKGELKIEMKLAYSDWITEFKVPAGDQYTDVDVVSTDPKENTRVAAFKTSDLNKPLPAKIHVTVESIQYDHDYTIRFIFDVKSLSEISVTEEMASRDGADVKPEAIIAEVDAAVTEPEQAGVPANAEASAAVTEPDQARTPASAEVGEAVSKPDQARTPASTEVGEAVSKPNQARTPASAEVDAAVSKPDQVRTPAGAEAGAAMTKPEHTSALEGVGNKAAAAAEAPSNELQSLQEGSTTATKAEQMQALASSPDDGGQGWIVLLVIVLLLVFAYGGHRLRRTGRFSNKL